MKLISKFDDFLVNTVDLNKTRFTQLEDSIDALKDVIKSMNWGPSIVGFAAQGSWAHKTIIKPLPGDPFDADLLVYVNQVAGWDARDYVNTLYSEFSKLAIYKEKIRRYSHCVTVEYVGERKIDIAPCVKGRTYPSISEVCNRTTNSFEISNPKDYTDWLIERNAITGSNNLRRAMRLLKYLRDIKTNFTCPSFLLTTLIGQQIYDSDRDTNSFSDVPTTLKTVIDRLDDWLQGNPTKPIIRNPVLYEEIQSKAWDEVKYGNFRSKINLYRTWIDDAYNEPDREESIGKWQRVFGNDFAIGEVEEKAAKVSEVAIADMRDHPLIYGIKDLVDLVIRMGRAALPRGFNQLPHMHRPKWREATNSNLTVNLSVQLYSGKYGQLIRSIKPLEPCSPEYWLRFKANNKVGSPFPDTYKAMWRVTNTDVAARNAKALRGDFYDSHDSWVRWERLSYRGVHMVEAFLIRRSDNVQLGKSDPFYVVIE